MNAIANQVSATGAGLAEYRSLRRELEDAVLPLAGSLDGRRFTFQASVSHPQVLLGGYVRLQVGEEVVLGQVTSLRTELQPGPVVELALDGSSAVGRVEVRFRAARGDGIVLGSSGPFTDARLERAAPSDVEAWLGGLPVRRAGLPRGGARLGGGRPFPPRPGGL